MKKSLCMTLFSSYLFVELDQHDAAEQKCFMCFESVRRGLWRATGLLEIYSELKTAEGAFRRRKQKTICFHR